MINYLTSKLRPDKGFAHFFHLSFIAVLPGLVFVLVRLELIGVALVVILLSKWRMLAVKPRYWLAHIRTNAVDIIISLSILVFMHETTSMNWQLLWVLIFEIWLLFIKPGDGVLAVSAQALLAQFVGFTSLFYAFPDVPLAFYVLAAFGITYFCARHYFGSFDEPHAQIFSAMWGFIGASMMWVLGHWLLFAGPISMPSVVLCSLGYPIAGLYYLRETDRLTPAIRRQIFMIMFAIMLVLSIWLVKERRVGI